MTRFAILVLFMTFGFIHKAVAAPKLLTLTNRSPDTVTALSATDKSDAKEALAVSLAEPVASQQSGDFTVDVTKDNCLADLTITFSTGEKQVQQDMDICGLDGIIVE